MKGGGGSKMFVVIHAQGIKTVNAGGRVKKWQNSVHVVDECPLIQLELRYYLLYSLLLKFIMAD